MFLEQMIKQTCEANENLRVLDLCAAPGGKSTLLSEIIGTDSLLVSNDAIRSRSVILSETLTKWGSGNILVTQSDPAAFARLPGILMLFLLTHHVQERGCSGVISH